MINKYAELIVKKGVNIQPGQELVISASVDAVELVRKVAEEAFKAGAKDVVVSYSDDSLSRLRFEYCELDHFDFVPQYIKESRNEYALRNACFLTILSTDPEALKGIDPLKIQKWAVNVRKSCDVFYEHLEKSINRWCIVGAPSQKWANRVFPDMSNSEAVEALWNAIFKVTRCDREDPLKEWELHHESFVKRVNYLNDMKIKTLHYKNALGTDFTIDLPKGYLFAGGASASTDGIYNFANVPTEEVFATPHKYSANGIVYSSLPLNHNGSLVDEFYLEFKDGRVINYDAKEGYEVLKSIIETDEGSHYLGEVALVPFDSPINNTGILFYNTLFDENASCHLAVGRGFNECIEDGLTLTKEQLEEKGINSSLTHVDFMIGTADLSIKAILEDGSEMTIFENGNYAF